MSSSVRSLDDVRRLARGPGAPKSPLRTLGLLGDVHAEDARLEAALTHLTALGVDRIACVGDVCDGEGSLARTCALLSDHGVVTVGGNHERWLLADRVRELPGAHRLATEPEEVWRFCRFLPPMLELSTVAGPALLCHGVAWDDMAVIDPDTIDRYARSLPALSDLLAAERFAWMLAGHTHRFMLRRFDHVGIVNAGTLARRDASGFDKVAGFVRIDFEARVVEHFELRGDPARGEVVIGEARVHPLV